MKAARPLVKVHRLPPWCPLLRAMAHDLDQHGALRTSTATAMWAGYTTHASVTGWALRHRSVPLPLSARSSRVAATLLIGAGVGMCTAGMSRFTSPRELAGTQNQALTTSGIYRHSRNPQYLGYLLALTGAALGRRSGTALISTGVAGAVYAAWVPIEEAHMSRLHGQAYAEYIHHTHRWWGRSTK